MRKRFCCRYLTVVLPVLAFLAGAAGADPYLIGVEDVLSISVWEHSELTMTATVNESGDIVVPPIGRIRAAGKTADGLARRLEETLETFLRQSVQVTVTIVGYNSRRVHVTGDVGAPGRYSFATIPHILEVMGSAGGPKPTADIANVRIIRVAEGDTTVVSVDLDNALKTGDLSSLPQLAVGDVIYVPSKMEEAEVFLPGEPDVAYVLGAVARPGPVKVGEGLALTRLMATVGGLRPEAHMERIRILARGPDGAGSWILEADLQEMLETGDLGPPVRPGELVYVPPREPGALGIASGVFRGVLGASRDLLNLILIGDYIRDN